MNPAQQPATVLGCLRAAVGPAADGPADAALLARFARDRDEAAFELLVWRHAGMVLAACRAVLRDHHAAEDACQATFLALARKAHAVGARGTAAGWLYRVARRTAARVARRRVVRVGEAELDRLPSAAPAGEPDPEAVAALHDELDRLPEKYRLPVLLCFLDGLTYADAARRLGWPVGTVAGRVARAKDWLRARLARRGVGVPAVGVAALSGAVPGVSPAFAAATARAGAAFAAGGVPGVSEPVLELAKGAIRAMTITKLQWAAGVLAACGALTAGGVWAGGQPTAPTAQPPARPTPVAQPPAPLPAERVATLTQRRLSVNKLKQLMLAVHNYESVNGHIPADVRGPDGKALLSWRVLLLPYIEQDALYRQFKLNEPWDSEHNLKLLGKMPDLLRVGFEPPGSTHTHYLAFAGPGTPFGTARTVVGGPGEGGAAAGGGPPPMGAGSAPPPAGGPAPRPGQPRRITLAQIPDGTSNTFGIVEAGPAVPWTKPADIPYDPKGPFPKVAWPFKNEIHVATLDGAVHTVGRSIPEADLRKWIEMDDGEVVPDLGKYRPVPAAVTPEEKAAVREEVAKNRARVAELEKLMKEQVELLGGLVGAAADPAEVQDQAQALEQLIQELRRRNDAIRGRRDEPQKK